MKNSLIYLMMLMSLLLTLVGCKDDVSTSFPSEISSYSSISNCVDSHSHHDANPGSHDTCAVSCTHNFIATSGELISLILLDGSSPNWTYLFSYKNQSLDTLKRPPLFI